MTAKQNLLNQTNWTRSLDFFSKLVRAFSIPVVEM